MRCRTHPLSHTPPAFRSNNKVSESMLFGGGSSPLKPVALGELTRHALPTAGVRAVAPPVLLATDAVNSTYTGHSLLNSIVPIKLFSRPVGRRRVHALLLDSQ